MLNLHSITSSFVVSFHICEVNIDPRSIMMSLRTPCNANIFLMKSSENCHAFISLVHGRK